jgi:hypothetical protein
MSRTKRRVDPVSLRYAKLHIAQGFSYSEKSFRRNFRLVRGQDGTGVGELFMDATIDRAGSFKYNTWELIWGRRSDRSRTNSLQRCAAKIKVRLGIADFYEEKYQEELDQLCSDEWYEDEGNDQDYRDWEYEELALERDLRDNDDYWCDYPMFERYNDPFFDYVDY